jgi:Helix-turn-helix domain/Cupin
VDPLSDVLRAVRLTGTLFFDVRAREPWVAETPQGRSVVVAMFPGSEHLISYHLILAGSCWIHVEGEPDLRLPPMQYLTHWRMQLAANYLQTSTDSIVDIASRVGYQSEAAFSRTFKKIVGSPPSHWRTKNDHAR